MLITPLWHTEFLVDIKNEENQNIRILVDAWLSDFVIGDLMERATKIKLNHQKLSSIDIIYLSHSHTDHIDPYTLVEIYTYANPILLLPCTLLYMEEVFRKYLPNARIEFLFPKKTFQFRWIELVGYMFSQENITNEDDVMMLSISNQDELLFAEIDTIPNEYDEEVQEELFKIFDRREYKTRLYLASRNELDGQLRIYDFESQKRKSFRSEYIANRKEEIRAGYEKFEYEEYMDTPNIYTLSGFVRGFIGQWLKYPPSLSESLSLVSIFPLDEIASMETDIARGFGYDFPQKALLPGRQYKVENASIETGRKECPIGDIVQNTDLDIKNPEEKRIYATSQLIPREFTQGEIEDAKKKILDILNHRFLPYWSASPVASLRSALIKNPDWAYRILLKEEWFESIIFEYSFASSGFSEIPFDVKMNFDEDYWLSDILDFLDWKQELYSNFWHKLDPKKMYRLWTCLGANFCNNDLVLVKYNLHFNQAMQWKKSEDWVMPILQSIAKN